MPRKCSYFVSDVHLGLQAFEPEERERRFVAFLRGICNDRTENLFLLGDIWDFWYEWKYVVPKGYVKVFAALTNLVDAGINVYFFCGNHDVWAYRYFEELGMKRLEQPAFVDIGGKVFCLGHGDALGRTAASYRIMYWIFHNRVLQLLFSSLIHPTVAMAIGRRWSRNNRLARRGRYVWAGKDEPLYEYALKVLRTRKVDCFVFGHLHVSADETLPGGSRLVILDSWIYGDNSFVWEE